MSGFPHRGARYAAGQGRFVTAPLATVNGQPLAVSDIRCHVTDTLPSSDIHWYSRLSATIPGHPVPFWAVRRRQLTSRPPAAGGAELVIRSGAGRIHHRPAMSP